MQQPCILCGSETAINELLGGTKWVNCSRCALSLPESVAAELLKLPDWPEFRAELARAVLWIFYKQGEQTVIIPDVASAEWLTEDLREAAKPEVRERAAVEALTSAGAFANPWHEPIMKLGRAVGLPVDEALLFAKDLEARGIVRIIAREARPLEGATSFPTVKQWERCEKKGVMPIPTCRACKTNANMRSCRCRGMIPGGRNGRITIKLLAETSCTRILLMSMWSSIHESPVGNCRRNH